MPRQFPPPSLIRGALTVLAVALGFVHAGPAAALPPAALEPAALAGEIDRRCAAFWTERSLTPAPPADELTLFRRVHLDLFGRIPLRSEWEAFAQNNAPLAEKYRAAVLALIASPEFALHWGAELDQLIQGDYAGNTEFVDYLRTRLSAGAKWDELFRELLVGPWDAPTARPAQRFLDQRAKDVDRLTTDAARVFFGVDISCARCHDHPLVDDWKQDHYYGLVSFFHRTQGGKGQVSEKNDGLVTFRTAAGEQKNAAVMFLTGAVIEPAPGASAAGNSGPAQKPPTGKVSRRRQLVDAALAEPQFLSRAIVNRVWANLLGRGLVHPVDQMHSGNAPSVPGLLEFLAEDLVASGYDLRRLIAALVLSRPYQLASQTASSAPAAPPPGPETFAAYPLRLLTRRQWGLSLLVATGNAALGPLDPAAVRAEKIAGQAGVARMTQYLAAEAKLPAFQQGLDSGRDHQSSAAEALFVSNSPQVQKWFVAAGETLTAKLAAEPALPALVDRAVRELFSRPPTAAEITELIQFVQHHPDRKAACQELVWALAASAEFRFQH